MPLLAPLGSEAVACSIMIDPGPDVTPAQRRALELRQARIAFEARRTLARANWAAGVDGAAALAEMLVPNVRPVPVEGDCGFVNEVDWAEGSESYRTLLVGTAFEGRARDFHHVLDRFEGVLPGRRCNAEFRSRFAGHMGRRLTPEQIRAAYLFLGARWPSLEPHATRTRIMRFARSGQRRPPLVPAVDDERQRDEILAWMRGNAAGRAVQRASDDFWRENAPLLDSMAATCPGAAARFKADRARLLAAMAAYDARRQAPIAAEKR